MREKKGGGQCHIPFEIEFVRRDECETGEVRARFIVTGTSETRGYGNWKFGMPIQRH